MGMKTDSHRVYIHSTTMFSSSYSHPVYIHSTTMLSSSKSPYKFVEHVSVARKDCRSGRPSRWAKETRIASGRYFRQSREVLTGRYPLQSGLVNIKYIRVLYILQKWDKNWTYFWPDLRPASLNLFAIRTSSLELAPNIPNNSVVALPMFMGSYLQGGINITQFA